VILDVIPTEGTRESIYASKILEKTLTDSFTKIKSPRTAAPKRVAVFFANFAA